MPGGKDGAMITPSIAVEILDQGVDVLTSGNHIWGEERNVPFLDEELRILRPPTIHSQGAGKEEVGSFTPAMGKTLGVLNLEGRVF